LSTLELARPEPAQGRFGLADALVDQELDHPGVHHGPARGYLAQRVQQVVEFADAGLEQVAQAVRAVAEQLHGVAGVRILGQDDDAGLGMVLPDSLGRFDALGLVTGRHPDVGQDGVGFQLSDRDEQFAGVPDAGQHVDLAGVLEQPPGALADEVVVLGDHDAQPVRHGPPLRWAARR
jgi:hypothetical protein